MKKDVVRKTAAEEPENYRVGAAYYLRELWVHLPAWFNLYTIAMVAMMAIVCFNPPQRASTLTALLPLFWFFIYIYARYSSDPTARGAGVPLAMLGLLAAGYLVFVNVALTPAWDEDVIAPIEKHFPGAVVGEAPEIRDASGAVLFREGEIVHAPNGRHYKIESKRLVNLENKSKIVYGFEFSNICWTILLMIHCWYFRGRNGFIKFFLAAGLYGFFLETGGVMMDYFRENDYHFYLPLFAAPVATMAGWSTVFYPCVFTYEMLARRWPRLDRVHPALAGLIISLTALMWDMHLDPVATGAGLWTWNERLPDWFLGVPLVNFTAWLSAVFAFGYGYTWVHRRTDWSEKKKVVAMFAMIPPVQTLAALIQFSICGLIEGASGPVWRICFIFVEKWLGIIAGFLQ